MSNAAARKCQDAISGAIWDLDNARATLTGVIRGRRPCKNPRAAIIEYIGSASDILKEAATAAAQLPISMPKDGAS